MDWCHKSCALQITPAERHSIQFGRYELVIREWSCTKKRCLYAVMCQVCLNDPRILKEFIYTGYSTTPIHRRQDSTRSAVLNGAERPDSLVSHFRELHPTVGIDGNIRVARVSDPFKNKRLLQLAEKRLHREVFAAADKVDLAWTIINKNF